MYNVHVDLMLYHTDRMNRWKRIIISTLIIQSRGGRLAIGRLAASPACQSVADRPPEKARVIYASEKATDNEIKGG